MFPAEDILNTKALKSEFYGVEIAADFPVPSYLCDISCSNLMSALLLTLSPVQQITEAPQASF